MDAAKKRPATTGIAGGAGNVMLGNGDITLTASPVQSHRVIFLQRLLHVPAGRAALIADLHFGGPT